MRVGVLALVVLCLAGCGGHGSHAAAGSTGPQVSGTECSSQLQSSGHPLIAECVFTLTDGSRFRCPPSFARNPPSVATLRHARACRRIASLLVPPYARAIFRRMNAARACLAARGFRVSGGPAFPQQAPGAALGEVVIVMGSGPTFVGYFKDARDAQARERQPATSYVARRGTVLIVSTPRLSAAREAEIRSCAFATR